MTCTKYQTFDDILVKLFNMPCSLRAWSLSCV